MFCGRETRQPERLREVLPFSMRCHARGIETDRRFLVTIARFDDKPIARPV